MCFSAYVCRSLFGKAVVCCCVHGSRVSREAAGTHTFAFAPPWVAIMLMFVPQASSAQCAMCGALVTICMLRAMCNARGDQRYGLQAFMISWLQAQVLIYTCEVVCSLNYWRYISTIDITTSETHFRSNIARTSSIGVSLYSLWHYKSVRASKLTLRIFTRMLV